MTEAELLHALVLAEASIYGGICEWVEVDGIPVLLRRIWPTHSDTGEGTP